MGPYATRECAQIMLDEFKERCQRLGFTGGRGYFEGHGLGRNSPDFGRRDDGN